MTLKSRLALGLMLALPLGAQAPELLRVAIVGSISTSKRPNFFWVMDQIPLQKFMLQLAKGPIDEGAAKAALAGTQVALKDLMDLGLVRLAEHRVHLHFALFTAADVARIMEVAEKQGASLAQAVLAQRKSFESLLETYDCPGVDRKAAAFILLGCASLDWDGLRITAAKGYRQATSHRPDGDYIPHAEEAKGTSERGIYWGSRNNEYQGLHFTSFGDDAAPRLEPPDYLAQPLLKVMLALRDASRTLDGLVQASGLPKEEVNAMLPLLLGYDWISEREGRFTARAPIFTHRDQALAGKIRDLGRQVQEAWLKANYPAMRADLQELSFMRAGVSFEEGFTMIWHFVFGLANRQLVAAGLFADPYAPERRFKGYLPVISDWPMQEN